MKMNDIKKIVEQMLVFMNIKGTIGIEDDSETGLTFFAIQSEEPSILIGFKGETLSALSHVLKKISDTNTSKEEKLSPETSSPVGGGYGENKDSFIVDVNGYQKKRINEIKDKAVILVERARYYKSSVEMDPMSPYERMIIHSLFSKDPDIKTESIGEGRERRVVVKYVGE
jgi:spoIIIJ-associated protein